MLIAVAFILMGVMFLAGMYVAGALGSLALILLNLFSDNPVWNIMGNRAWETNTNVNLVAIPLFILMGEIVLRGGFADLMYRALSRWVDFIPGGLMHTNIASCAVFAACAGSSIATAATVSRVALPSFRAQGYQERLVVGSLAAGGTLGILIPPSILLVLYGLTVGESIGRLFLAGFIPGILLALVFMLMIGVASVIWPAIAPRQQQGRFWTWEGWTERLLFTVLMVPVMALIFIVLGSIYLGWATPSEAAGFRRGRRAWPWRSSTTSCGCSPATSRVCCCGAASPSGCRRRCGQRWRAGASGTGSTARACATTAGSWG